MLEKMGYPWAKDCVHVSFGMVSFEGEALSTRKGNLFLLEDGRVAIIDYESAYKKGNHLKYLGYAHRVLERYFGEGKTDVELVMIVIYTADVTRNEVKSSFNAGMVTITEEAAFLSELKSDEIRKKLDAKVKSGEDLTDEEIMEFIILPLSYKKEKQNQAIEDTINMAKEIKDEDTMVFVLSGILVFSDKVIDDEFSKKTKEWIAMTKVGRLFAEEAEQKAQRAAAKQLIDIIDNIISKGNTLDQACDIAGITHDDYDKAKKLVDSTAVVA